MPVAQSAQLFHNVIAGKRVESRSGNTFESRNPAHWDQVLGVFPRSGKEDVAAAVAAAQAAFPSWRSLPAPSRGEILLKAAMLLEQRKEELARTMTQEMGKVLIEARGDVQEAIDMGKYIAGGARRPTGETVPSELRNKWAMTTRVPIGTVGIITPWNFPMAIPSWKIFPALLAGNTVVFKPAEDTPLCALRLVEIFEEAGLPAGVLNIVFGLGEEAGEALIRHPGVGAIAFTGSSEVGAHIGEVCGASLKRYSVELGGKNPIIVMDDADLSLAVDGALWGAFGTSGQRCTASSRLIVHDKVYDRFLGELKEHVLGLRLGDGLDESVEVGPVINEKQLERIHSYTGIGREEGAKLVTGGNIAKTPATAGGFFYEPTVFAEVAPTMRIAKEEIFGPTVVVLRVAGFEEAVAAANESSYGLSASIYTSNVNYAFAAMEALNTGIVYVNAPTIGAEIQLPFGGVKSTGNGHRDAGTLAMEQFTEVKSIYVDFSGRLQRAQIDTDR